jgi:hypothetical protein
VYGALRSGLAAAREVAGLRDDTALWQRLAAHAGRG